MSGASLAADVITSEPYWRGRPVSVPPGGTAYDDESPRSRRSSGGGSSRRWRSPGSWEAPLHSMSPKSQKQGQQASPSHDQQQQQQRSQHEGHGHGPSQEHGGGYSMNSVTATSFMGSLSFVQVQMMAFIVVFTSSGLVPLEEIFFVVFLTLYSLILATWAFPPVSRSAPPKVFSGNRLFKVHVTAGAVIGMFLPLSYVLGGFAKNDHMAVECVTPHLFLLSCQVLTENIIVDLTYVSLPVRALIPIMYNWHRLSLLAEWNRRLLQVAAAATSAASVQASANSHPASGPTGASSGVIIRTALVGGGYWQLFGRYLAVANLVYWSLNLFGFLLPVFLPRAFKRHFEMEAAAATAVPPAGLSSKEKEKKAH
ncbi:hypothetical protein CLOM_g8029 [Closterium sp. NIES-68]|nr:hypothetical protein CLOM_g8029 [Closterium sp. NIES-68]GJP73122.1 hypothetical protein CLOP_g3865 [Closterium sp. NIES-67]